MRRGASERTARPGRIAIVGAGIAGLAAARRLALEGCAVVVFDKGSRPGGRSSTRARDGLAFDHGAQYFTVRDPRFGAKVADWSTRGIVARWEAPVRTLRRGIVDLARSERARYVGTPGMGHLSRDLAVGVGLHCGTHIRSIEGGRGGWKLADASGRGHEGFDAVLLATPPAQAAPLLAGSPALAARAAQVPMKPCIAMMAAFDEPLGLDFGGAFVSDSPLAWVACDASKPGRRADETWVLHASADWSADCLEDLGEAPARQLLDAFDAALGRPGLPPLRHHRLHRWRYALPATGLGESCLFDPEAGLGVCGDWLQGGGIESAWLSGRALAGSLLGVSEPAVTG